MRLNAYLARAGVASGRKADELIKAGRVTVNGETAPLNAQVGRRDRVELDGRPVVNLVDHPVRVVPVGRLDADTTGALLLTNDGDLAHRLAHPRYEVDKVYEVEVEGEPDDAALARLAEGVDLDDGRTAPAQVRRRGPTTVELTIHEGRKHQVKRMLEAVGHPVTRLHRSRYANLSVEGLEPGAWHELEPSEVDQLRTMPAPAPVQASRRPGRSSR